MEHIDGGTDAPRVCVPQGRWKLVAPRAYPPMLHDLEDDPVELNDVAEARADTVTEIVSRVERAWPMGTLQETVQRSQAARKLVDGALATGRQEFWDHTPHLPQPYVSRGDGFPDVARRG